MSHKVKKKEKGKRCIRKRQIEYVESRAVIETSGKAKGKQRFLENHPGPWGSVLKPIFICPSQGCECVQRLSRPDQMRLRSFQFGGLWGLL